MPIELEFRGPLTKSEFSNLNKKLSKISKKHKELERFSMIYLSPGSKSINSSKIDVRARINNGIPEIVMKFGPSSSSQRKEHTLEISHASFFDSIAFLSILGFQKGFLQTLYKHLYDYKAIEIDLGYIPYFGYYFEIEKVVYDKRHLGAAKAEINGICAKLGLRFYEKGEYDKAIEQLDRKQKTFDLKKENIWAIAKRYPKYFKQINRAYSNLQKNSGYVYRY